MSKLPKLSGDQRPPVDQAPPAGAPVPADNPRRVEPVADFHRRDVPTTAGAEAWISFGIAAILLFLNPGLLIFLTGGDPGAVTDAQGNPMRYVDSIFFQRDLAVTAFAVALILEGMVIAFIRNPIAVLAVMVFTVLATLGNLAFLLSTYRAYGLPLVSAFAVVFGGYMAMNEWRLYQRLKGIR
ncbi:MAG TPA: hypothetical protein VGN72_02585 [Tepidisphaeraceae bacterium]|nr:hypothetical protein [Tepidisphaeraceae bacterium]